MLQACIMSGLESDLSSDSKFYLTLMGGCELRAPTIAKQILAKQNRPKPDRAFPVTQTFVTFLGSTEIKVPTLAQEYLEYRDLIQSGSLNLGDWDRFTGELGRIDVKVVTFTIMGGYSEGELPTDDEEIDSLALQTHLGNIQETASEILKHGIGQRGAERRAILRRALAAQEGVARV